METRLTKLRALLEGSIAGAPGEALQRAPAGKWNSEQILEHLYLTYKGTNKGIAKCLDGGKPLATHATIGHHLRRLLVVGLGYLPDGAKAPERSVPRGMPIEEVREKILGELEKMDAGLNDCERRFGVGTKIMDHPLLGPLTSSEWQKFHWVHGRHHVRQIQERIKP